MEDDLLLIESSDDDLRYSHERIERMDNEQGSERKDKKLRFSKEVRILEEGSMLEDDMSSIRMSHDTTEDFIMEGPSILLKGSDIVSRRAKLHDSKHKSSMLRSLRPSHPEERAMHQSTNRKNPKMGFEDFKYQSITFDKHLSSMKSLKHILSLKKSDRLHDFKEFFSDARTLIVYQETIKLTMLLQVLRKDITDIQEEFQLSLVQSERFFALIEKLKDIQKADFAVRESYKQLLKEKNEIIAGYEEVLDKLIAERERPAAVTAVVEPQPQEQFKIDKTLERIVLPRADRQQNLGSYVTPVAQEVSPNHPQTEPRKHEHISTNVFDQGDTTFVEHSQRAQRRWTEEDILLSFRENLQDVGMWFSEHSETAPQAVPTHTLQDSSGFLQKVGNAFFALCKIINANSNHMKELVERDPNIRVSEFYRRCLKESLQAIRNLSQQILAEAMSDNKVSSVLHRHLSEHEQFAKELCKLCFHVNF